MKTKIMFYKKKAVTAFAAAAVVTVNSFNLLSKMSNLSSASPFLLFIFLDSNFQHNVEIIYKKN